MTAARRCDLALAMAGPYIVTVTTTIYISADRLTGSAMPIFAASVAVVLVGLLAEGAMKDARHDITIANGAGSAVVVSTLFAAQVIERAWRGLDAPFGLGGPAAWIAGIVAFLGGVLLRVAARRAMRGGFGHSVGVSREQRIVTDGPYRHIRHPAYLGTALALGGSAMMMGAPLNGVLLLMAVPLGLRRIAAEEDLLRRTCGGVYDDYASRVQKLIPHLY